MLFSTGLPKKFWGEAVDTTTILINRSPSATRGFKTPRELWNFKPHDLSFLKIFGCQAYAHIKDTNWTQGLLSVSCWDTLRVLKGINCGVMRPILGRWL